MTSQIAIVMSTSAFFSGSSRRIDFLETFAPSVRMYESSNWSKTNRRIRDVFPTAASPTRQIFDLSCTTSAIGSPLCDARPSSLDDLTVPRSFSWLSPSTGGPSRAVSMRQTGPKAPPMDGKAKRAPSLVAGMRASPTPARELGSTIGLRGSDRAEESVLLVVRARGEEQRVRRAVGRRAVSELQGPESVDCKPVSVGRAERTGQLEGPVRLFLVRVDVAVPEVSDEQVAAEEAEARRGHRNAPRRVQLAALRDADEQVPGGVVGVDEAEARTSRLVIRARGLPRVCDEDSRADRLDPERGVSGGETRIDESARRLHGPGRVDHIDARVGEIGRIELQPGRGRGDREPLVDRARAGGVHLHLRHGPEGRMPAGNRAAFGREDEHRPGVAAAHTEARRIAVEDETGRSTRNADFEGALRPGRVVERR